MRFKLLNFLTLVFILSFLVFPLAVSAVDYLPLVPCGLKKQPSGATLLNPDGTPYNYTQSCTRCHAFKLAENVIDFGLLGIVPPVAAVLFVFAGLMILLGGAMPKRIELGRTIFKNTFIGLLIILASWLIANTFIQSFGPDQAKGSWFKFTCKDNVVAPGGPTLPDPLCSNPSALAARYNTSPTIKNAPELDRLIACVLSLTPISEKIDQSRLYTYERQNRLCNYTRGNKICGICSHRVNSCHYGGPTGNQGSLAVDFNARGISEQELFNRLKTLKNACNFGFILFKGDHTHVSTRSCVGDTGGD